MAILTGAYDPNAEAQQDFAPIPSGKYLAQIVDSDLKPTKKNDGHFLELTYEIVEGDYKNRKVWARINLDNPNPKTVEIGNRQFSSVRQATGVLNPRDSQELHYKPHLIRVEFIPAGTTQKNGYVTERDANEIKGWEAVEGGLGNVPSAAPSAAAATAASPSSAMPPWKRNAA